MRTSSDQTFSIVLEWENKQLADNNRCYMMLRKLGSQIDQAGLPVEIIVVFNSERTTRPEVEKELSRHLRTDKTIGVRIEDACASHYYDMKNRGAILADGDIVVFIDSDVVPEDNWLKQITSPFFDNPAIQVLAGHTYISTDSFLGKIFALGWFFPLRIAEKRLHSSDKIFFANNVAFRREVIRSHPFPPMPTGVTRGSCGELARSLLASGHLIWTNTAARADHPAPAGVTHFFKRAMAQGRDRALFDRNRNGIKRGRVARQLRWANRKTVTVAGRIIKKQRLVQLPPWAVPPGIVVMTTYYILVSLGYCLAVLFPRYASVHWQI